jgi:hypothetical protein
LTARKGSDLRSRRKRMSRSRTWRMRFSALI